MSGTIHRHGFLEFGSDDPDVLVYDILTSSTGLNAEATVAGSPSFTDDGMLHSGGSKLQYSNTIAAALSGGGHISLEIENGFFDSSIRGSRK